MPWRYLFAFLALAACSNKPTAVEPTDDATLADRDSSFLDMSLRDMWRELLAEECRRAARDHHLRALSRELLRDGGADAARSTRHDRRLPFQPHLPPPRLVSNATGLVHVTLR